MMGVAPSAKTQTKGATAQYYPQRVKGGKEREGGGIVKSCVKREFCSLLFGGKRLFDTIRISPANRQKATGQNYPYLQKELLQATKGLRRSKYPTSGHLHVDFLT